MFPVGFGVDVLVEEVENLFGETARRFIPVVRDGGLKRIILGGRGDLGVAKSFHYSSILMTLLVNRLYRNSPSVFLTLRPSIFPLASIPTKKLPLYPSLLCHLLFDIFTPFSINSPPLLIPSPHSNLHWCSPTHLSSLQPPFALLPLSATTQCEYSIPHSIHWG